MYENIDIETVKYLEEQFEIIWKENPPNFTAIEKVGHSEATYKQIAKEFYMDGYREGYSIGKYGG